MEIEGIASAARGIARLLRAAMRVIGEDDSDPMKVAVRVAVEQLAHKDSALGRACLAFAADQLADAHVRWQLRDARDALLLELVRAACLARTGHEDAARAIAAASRARAHTLLAHNEAAAGGLTLADIDAIVGAAARGELRTDLRTDLGGAA